MNYELTHEQCCDNVEMSLYFGMYLTNLQTDEELIHTETIEDNGVGWNKPDSSLSQTFLLLINEYERTGKIIITTDLIRFHWFKLRKVLKKYKRQYQSFIDDRPFHNHKPQQTELF